MSLPSDDFVAQTIADTRVPVVDAMRTVRSPKHSTRYRVARAALIAAGGAILIGLTAAALAVAREPQPVVDSSATCYEHPSLDAARQGMDTPDTPFDPIGLCSDLYDVPASELTACELPGGTAGVFPREGLPADDFCDSLGLPEWKGSSTQP